MINQYNNKVINRFSTIYNNAYGEDFLEFLSTNEVAITELLKKLINNSEYIKEFLKKNLKTKKRWVDAAFNNVKSSFNIEIQTALNLYEQKLNTIDRDTIFSQIYNVPNPKEFRTKQINVLEKWHQDKYSYFSDFIYIKDKKGKSRTNAFINDIALFVLMLHKENEKDIIKIPYMLQDIPEDTTNRIKIAKKKNDNSNDSINTNLYYDKKTGDSVDMEINQKQYLSFFSGGGAISQLDKEIQEEIIKQIKVFNSLDRNVLQYVLLQTKELYSADKIEREICDITTSIGRDNSFSNREEVKKTLYKLGSSGYSKNNKFVGRFFSVRIEKNKTGKDVAHIYIDGMLREIILNNNTFNFYADTFNLLSSDAQRILISLQSERILRILNDDSNLISIKYYSDFTRMIYFSNKRSIKPRVLSALNELVQYNMAIRTYEEIDRYQLKLEFFKFSEADLKFIKGDNFKYGDFIEGSYDVT